MHKEAYEFLKEGVELLPEGKLHVLEIGSLDINSTAREMNPRDLFGGPYTGIDITKGKGVDRVMSSHGISFKGAFDVVVCLEMLEHDSMPWVTAKKIYDCLKPDGYVILSTTNLVRPQHYTHYFNYSIEGILSLFSMFEHITCKENTTHGDIHYIGRKR